MVSSNQNAPPAKYAPSRRPNRAQVFCVLVRLRRVHVFPDDLETVAGKGQVHVVVGPLIYGQDLERTALLQSARLLAHVDRDVTIQEANARPLARQPGSRVDLTGRVVGDDLGARVHDGTAEVVFGEVGDAGRRVYVHRLVREEAHPPNRCPRQLVLGSFGSTSKTYPCPVVRSSSQVSQVPHGVAPPAQLLRVPEEVT